jgi:hypothetical protein
MSSCNETSCCVPAITLRITRTGRSVWNKMYYCGNTTCSITKRCVTRSYLFMWFLYHLRCFLLFLRNERRLSTVAITHKKITKEFWNFGYCFKITLRRCHTSYNKISVPWKGVKSWDSFQWDYWLKLT